MHSVANKTQLHFLKLLFKALQRSKKHMPIRGHTRKSSHRKSFSMAAMTVRTIAAASDRHPQKRPLSYQGGFSGGLVCSAGGILKLRWSDTAREIFLSIRFLAARSLALWWLSPPAICGNSIRQFCVRYTIPCFCAALLAAVAGAQTRTLSGVVETRDGKPLRHGEVRQSQKAPRITRLRNSKAST